MRTLVLALMAIAWIGLPSIASAGEQESCSPIDSAGFRVAQSFAHESIRSQSRDSIVFRRGYRLRQVVRRGRPTVLVTRADTGTSEATVQCWCTATGTCTPTTSNFSVVCSSACDQGCALTFQPSPDDSSD